MLNNALILVATALTLTSALPAPAPASAVVSPATLTATSPRTTHTVVAGRGEKPLRFDPDNIVAEVGSIVEFHYLPLNHSVAESSFSAPCQPKPAPATSFFSGFFPVPRAADGGVTQSGEVFQIEVKDTKPIWFYCPQNTGRHCQSGMVGVVNQNFDGAATLAKHRELAAQVPGLSQVPAGGVQGGWRGANPNPLGGF